MEIMRNVKQTVRRVNIEILGEKRFERVLNYNFFSVADGNCGHIIFTERTGEFKTPDYPKTYPSHSKCSWLIKAPSGYKIKLQYFDFVLESSFNCNSDNVKIYEGKNSSATLIGKYCGEKNPFNVETPRSYMYITFKSDRSLNYRGFKASFVMEAMRPIKSMIFKRTLMDTTVKVVGQQVKFTCQVKDGSLNIVISWTKDGKSLSRSKSNFTMIKNSSYNKKSTLLLTRVSKHDAGEYNCTVEDIDMGRKISSSGSLLVKGTCSTELIHFWALKSEDFDQAFCVLSDHRIKI